MYKRYIHNPIGLKEKVELKYGKIAEAGFMAERDVGEEDWNDMQKYYIMGKDIYFIKKIIWGNYRLYFGQGLVLYEVKKPTKGGEVIKIKQKSKGIKPDLSSYENAFFYGPALQLNFGWIDIYGFYSFKKYDASLEDQATRYDGTDDTPDNPDDNIITSFDPEDYCKHLTVSDKKKIGVLERKFIGGRVEISPKPEIKIGLSYFHSTYSIPLNPEVKNNYYYRFRGDWLDALGFDFDYIYGPINFFGEIAWSFFPKIDDPVHYNPYDPSNPDESDNGMGFVVGNVLDVGKFETALLYRKYDKDFYNYDNGPFREAGKKDYKNNEEGFYFATRLKIDRNTKFWFYSDIFIRDWRRWDEPMPSRGYEVYGQLERKFLRKFKYTFRTKIENKDMEVSTDQGNQLLWVQNDWRIRNEIEWAPSKSIRYRIRYEFARTAYEDLDILYNGYLVFFDVKYAPTKRLTFYLRDIIFDMPYEAQIWEYENTVSSYMENLTFYGTGMGNRIYLMIKDQVDKNWVWEFKIARTTYFKATSIERPELLGEEEEETEEAIAESLMGNSQYDYRLTIQYKF